MILNLTPNQLRLDRRLHDTTWGLLLMLTGVVWLVPAETVPAGTWLFGVAAILLAVNVVRYLSNLGVNAFSAGLGFAALIAAIAQMWRTDLPLLALCVLLIGASLVFKPWLTRAA